MHNTSGIPEYTTFGNHSINNGSHIKTVKKKSTNEIE